MEELSIGINMDDREKWQLYNDVKCLMNKYVVLDADRYDKFIAELLAILKI